MHIWIVAGFGAIVFNADTNIHVQVFVDTHLILGSVVGRIMAPKHVQLANQLPLRKHYYPGFLYIMSIAYSPEPMNMLCYVAKGN